MKKPKLTIGILTGGGDVPGLNPAIRALTIRAIDEGYRVIGIRRGWAGLVDMVRDPDAPHDEDWQELNLDTVNRVGRTGGTFLHTSRIDPSGIERDFVPAHLSDKYGADTNDLTPELLENLAFLGIDALIPIGGEGTLRYAVRLQSEGVNVVAIPKTMDNNVAGTDYCIGFSTCVTRTIELTHNLRTSAGSHERFAVIEVFGRDSGFTAMLPTMAGASSRCVIPEHPFDIEHLCDLLVHDRKLAPSNYSVVLVSEGASIRGEVPPPAKRDRIGGIGDIISARLKEISPKYNGGKRINVVNQRLGYLVRCGDPDALDAIVPMAFGNLALDLVTKGTHGRMVNLRRGVYDHVPLDVLVGREKRVDVAKYYNTERLRPYYKDFSRLPIFIMTADV